MPSPAAHHLPTPPSGRGSARPSLPTPGGSGGCPERGGSAGCVRWGRNPQAVPLLPHPTPPPRSASDPMFPPATGASERTARLPRALCSAPDDSLCLSQLIQRERERDFFLRFLQNRARSSAKPNNEAPAPHEAAAPVGGTELCWQRYGREVCPAAPRISASPPPSAARPWADQELHTYICLLELRGRGLLLLTTDAFDA